MQHTESPMIHIKSSIHVYFTNDYARFRMITGNRQLNERKINNIISDIAEGNDMRRYYPIQVKENGDRLDILDGQHRFYICKHLRSPVYYILVTEEKSMPDIAKINSNVDKWSNEDFINCYVQHDNKHYITLRRFLDTYGLSVGLSLKMLSIGRPDGGGSKERENKRDDFHHGLFAVKFLDYAMELAEDCKRFSAFDLWRDRNFFAAIHKIKQSGLIPLSDVLEAFLKRPELLTRQISPKDYIYTLEQIVNVGKQKRILIAA